jgi:hypothetical protein
MNSFKSPLVDLGEFDFSEQTQRSIVLDYFHFKVMYYLITRSDKNRYIL